MFARDDGATEFASPRPWSILAWSAGLFLAVLLTAGVSIALPRDGLLAPVWMANACVLASLLANRPRVWPALLAGAVFGNLVAERLGQISLASGSVFVVSNLAEDLLAALLFKTWSRGDMGLISPRALLRLAGACCLAVGVSALASSSMILVLTGAPIWVNLRTWALAHTLGLLTLTPCLLIIGRWGHYLNGKVLGWRAAGAACLLVLVTVAVFAQSRFPVLFLVPPALLLVSLEVEIFGAAAGVLTVEVIALTSLFTRTGPLTLVQGDTVEKSAVIQIFLIAALLSSLPIAVLNARRRQAMAALTQSEARYRLLTENANDLVTEMSRSGYFTYVSPAVTAITGYDVTEVVGHTALDFIHTEDRERVTQAFANALSGEPGWRIEYRVVCKNGQLIWVEARPSVVRDRDTGKVVAVTDVLRDITDHKAAQAALAESEARYRRLADNASDIVVEASLDGVFTYVSPAARSITGFDEQDLTGRHSMDLVHPDDRSRVEQEITAALKSSDGTRIEHRHIAKNGRVIWVETRPALARDPQTGRAVAVTDVIRDITERKAAQTKLAESEARYRLLADNASDMITQFKPGGAITFITPGCRQILGYDPEEMVGRRALELAHPDDLEVVRAYYKALRQSPGSLPDPLQFRARHKKGQWVWLEGQPKMFFDAESGEAVEMQDVVRDVTKRKELESQLRHARTEAESAAAVKSEFLANMSHELRTPLTSILGFSKLLGDQGGLDNEGRRYLQRVSDASQALLTTVNDILDFSKLEAGQVEISPHPIDPAALARSAAELLGPQAAAKGLTLTVDCKGLPSEVVADDTRIRQILLNLVSNAVKFTATGGVTVQARYNESAQRLRFEVIDTGPGVPADRLNRLFKRFSQVDASTTRSHGGTGLGLAICKGLAEAMGGDVGASSVVGTGSRFWFDLPCAPVAQTAANSTMAALCASADLQGLRALIVDDNAVNRELVRIILTPFGVALTEADGGRAALSLADNEPFDLILMDVRMPDMDGPTAARTIRAGASVNANVPIIAFTAEANDRELPAAWKGVFNDQLPKPIIAADLLAIVDEWSSVQTPEPISESRRRGLQS